MKDRQGSSANSTVTWQQQGWHRASVKITNLRWSCRANDLDGYHLDLPVDVPLLHVAEAPGFDGIPGACIHPDQTVVGDADQLLALPTLEPARREEGRINDDGGERGSTRLKCTSVLTWQENGWFQTRAGTATPGWSASLPRSGSSGPRSGGLQGSGLKSDKDTTAMSAHNQRWSQALCSGKSAWRQVLLTI